MVAVFLMVHCKYTTFFRKKQVTVKDLRHFSGQLVYSYQIKAAPASMAMVSQMRREKNVVLLFS